MDTVTARGVDARTYVSKLSIPELWLFGSDDNSVPTRKSVAVLDGLRSAGKPVTTRIFAQAGHMLFTRAGGLPHVVDYSWQVMPGSAKSFPAGLPRVTARRPNRPM